MKFVTLFILIPLRGLNFLISFIIHGMILLLNEKDQDWIMKQLDIYNKRNEKDN